MRGFLLLSIVGVALYALLLFTDNALRESPTEEAFGKAQPSHAAERTLRAWGRNLPALVIQQPPEPRSQYSGGDFGADGQLAASEQSTEAKLGYAEQEPVEWAEIMLAARAHSEASVSSPTIRFYTPGIQLQILRRQDGWVEVIDPQLRNVGGSLNDMFCQSKVREAPRPQWTRELRTNFRRHNQPGALCQVRNSVADLPNRWFKQQKNS